MKTILIKNQFGSKIILNYNNLESICAAKGTSSIYFNAVGNNTDEVSYQMRFSNESIRDTNLDVIIDWIGSDSPIVTLFEE